ncbi:MAG: methylmalonyl-CoA epimerase [Chloroflexota bacterium]|nr:MAG: methylmalonyl-CoA epimerase [Chloroflexota bacterium]
MNGRIDHIGIITSDSAAAAALYARVASLMAEPSVEHAEEGVRITFLRPTGADPAATTIELIEPTRADTGVARYLEKRGEGMHHVCLEVEDIVSEIGRLSSEGYEVLDREPRRGMHREKLAFIHPRSGRGVLIELYEKGSRHP